MTKRTISALIMGLALALPGSAMASNLRYQPVNPSFGGSSFNGDYLLQSANAQKKYTQTTSRTNPLDQFAQTLQSRLLAQLAANITDAIFGENAADSGSFTVGTTQVNFQNVGDKVIITIVDLATGGSTTVEVPTAN